MQQGSLVQNYQSQYQLLLYHETVPELTTAKLADPVAEGYDCIDAADPKFRAKGSIRQRRHRLQPS